MNFFIIADVSAAFAERRLKLKSPNESCSFAKGKQTKTTPVQRVECLCKQGVSAKK